MRQSEVNYKSEGMHPNMHTTSIGFWIVNVQSSLPEVQLELTVPVGHDKRNIPRQG